MRPLSPSRPITGRLRTRSKREEYWSNRFLQCDRTSAALWRSMSECVRAINDWMSASRLKLNPKRKFCGSDLVSN